MECQHGPTAALAAHSKTNMKSWLLLVLSPALWSRSCPGWAGRCQRSCCSSSPVPSIWLPSCSNSRLCSMWGETAPACACMGLAGLELAVSECKGCQGVGEVMCPTPQAPAAGGEEQPRSAAAVSCLYSASLQVPDHLPWFLMLNRDCVN